MRINNKKKENLKTWAAEAGETLMDFLSSFGGETNIEKIEGKHYNQIKNDKKKKQKKLEIDKTSVEVKKETKEPSSNPKTENEYQVIIEELKNIISEIKNSKSEIISIIKSDEYLRLIDETTITINKTEAEKKEVEEKLDELEKRHTALEKRYGREQENFKNTNNELQNAQKQLTSNKSSTLNIKDVLNSNLSVVDKNDELVKKIIEKSIEQKKINNGLNALLLTDRLLKSSNFENDVFSLEFEGDVAQLISVDICKAFNSDESGFKEFIELIDFINNQLKTWEIIKPEGIGTDLFDESKHVEIGNNATQSSRIKKFQTLPIRIKNHTENHTTIKKAIVEI